MLYKELQKLFLSYEDADFICNGFKEGFDLGYEGELGDLRSRNSLSVSANVDIAFGKIKEEISLGRIEGPFDDPPFVNFKCCPLALREKSTKGKYRLLHNLSFPYDKSSVNLNIPDSKAKVKYATLLDAFNIIYPLNNCFLAKSDIKDAFRIVPLNPNQYNLTGFKLNGKFYYDKCLPMGARSACQIFERFSTGLKHILITVYKVPHVIKVLDDFLFVGKSSEECRYGLECFKHLCNRTGVPLAEHKTVGPTTALSFLGIEIDTSSQTASIPVDKLKNYAKEVSSLLTETTCTYRQLKSILGKLQFACTIIPSGRCFLRRLHDLTIGKSNPNSQVGIPTWAREDLIYWKAFLDLYNGRNLYHFLWRGTSEDLHFFTDSSKSGYGGTFGSHFIQGVFPPDWSLANIAVLELYPIFALVHIFGPQLANSHVIFHSDNEAVVFILNNKTSKDPMIMKLLRPLVLVLMKQNIIFRSLHIPGVKNIVSDHLSRYQADASFLRHHALDASPTPVPATICPTNWKP